MSDALPQKRMRLLELIQSYGSCGVALSGGVDSAVTAKAAQLALSDRAVAFTGVSPSLATGELEAAREIAGLIGIRHVEVATNEMSREGYTQNAGDRCYHCKTELYTQIGDLTEQLGVVVIANGANVDDLDDYRPGILAAQEHNVASPLAECEITKADVRALAADWDLPIWDKPASPCLSSRIAYGEEVTPHRLRMVDECEQLLRELGVWPARVRYHRGDLARIEAPPASLSLLAEESIRERIVAAFRQAGFRFISLDLEGFRSGSLNQLVELGNYSTG